MIGTGLEELRCIVEDALDELCSPRSSSDVRTRALDQLEKQLASACLAGGEGKESWDHFMALQYTFECNIPLRLIGWIATTTRKLEYVLSLNKASNDDEICISSQLMMALGIVQGIALSHESSKVFLGRRYSLEVLLDLLLTSRHMTPVTTSEEDKSSSRSKQSTELPPPLSSLVMDTLLCILVDSSKAMRSFESAHGVQAIVKILKRAGTPREVRMKCLEFIYFYLLDETVPTEAIQSPRSPCASPPPSTPARAPRTLSEGRLSKPSLNATPLRPLARHGSASSSEFSTSSSNSSGSRSTSGSSMNSFTSMSSVSTPASSIASSPEKNQSARQALSNLNSQVKGPSSRAQTPFSKSSPFPPKFPQTPKPVARPNTSHGGGNGNDVTTNLMMMMLKKDVDYEPLSPKKSGFSSRERVNTPYHPRSGSTSSSISRPRAQTHGQLYTPSRNYTSSSMNSSMSMSMNSIIADNSENDGQNGDRKKTTEEKKLLLGTMLGNVDALVEGVRKAGIWGLA